MWKLWMSFSILLTATPVAHGVDRVVGVTAPSGGASLVKRVHVAAGSEIARVEIVSNDLATVFPSLRLRRLEGRSAGEILSEVRDVSPNNGSRHRFTLSVPPVVFSDDEDILVEVVLPPTSGVEMIGSEAGLGANELAGARATSYIGNTVTGELQTIDADLCLFLLGPAPLAKSEPSSPAAGQPEPAFSSLLLQVRAGFGTDLQIDVTTSSSIQLSLEIYDVRGARVRTLARGDIAAGQRTFAWDRCNDVGRRVAAGVYFVVARMQNLEVTRKTIVLH